MRGSTTYSGLKTIYASPKSKDLPKPHFKLTTKVDGAYTEETPETELSGIFSGLQYHLSTYKDGSTSESYNLTLEDRELGERYVIDIPFNNIGRSAMNALLSLEKSDTPYILKVYITLGKKNAEGKQYPKIGIVNTTTDESLSWKYSLDDLPKVNYVKVNGKNVGDYEALNVFLKKEIDEKFTDEWFESSKTKARKDFDKKSDELLADTPFNEESDELSPPF